MSLQYIVDGYNIIKQMPLFKEAELRDGREKLIRFIEVHRPQGSLRNKVTVVFDGQVGGYNYLQRTEVKIIFTRRGESADARIKRIVEESPHPNRLVIVTDDREIILFTRSCGAKVISVKEFMAKKTRRQTSVHPSLEDKPSPSSPYAQSITAELAKIWLQ